MIGRRPNKVFDPERGFEPPSGAFDMGQHHDDLVPNLQTGMRAPSRAAMKKKIMRKSDPNFRKFCDFLAGPRYLNFREVKGKGTVWNCDHTLTKTRTILKKHFPQYDLEGTIRYFEEHGGYCDCEVIFNVER